jgi:hypothetical protein
LAGESELCGDLPLLRDVAAEAMMTDGCHAAIDTLWVLLRCQCTRDLVEEFLCAKVLPLRAKQEWFAMKDDERYQEKGLKGLVIDVNAVWEKILMKSKKCSEGLNAIYREVEAMVENLVGKLGAVKIKVINAAHGDHHRLNRVYDLLGITYTDWPSPADDVGGGKKRKGAEALGKAAVGERRGHGHGRGSSGSAVSRQAVVEVCTSGSLPAPGAGGSV